MRSIASLIEGAQPSAVAIQSGVLVLFVTAFAVVIFKLLGTTSREQSEAISQRALED
jgi:hypothetical protein